MKVMIYITVVEVPLWPQLHVIPDANLAPIHLVRHDIAQS
jgi:hypothetical protein